MPSVVTTVQGLKISRCSEILSLQSFTENIWFAEPLSLFRSARFTSWKQVSCWKQYSPPEIKPQSINICNTILLNQKLSFLDPLTSGITQLLFLSTFFNPSFNMLWSASSQFATPLASNCTDTLISLSPQQEPCYCNYSLKVQPLGQLPHVSRCMISASELSFQPEGK